MYAKSVTCVRSLDLCWLAEIVTPINTTCRKHEVGIYVVDKDMQIT